MEIHRIVFTERWHCPWCGVAEEEFTTADYMLIEPCLLYTSDAADE